MKFLEIEITRAMFTAVNQIKNGAGNLGRSVRVITSVDVAKKRHIGSTGGGFERGDRDSENGVRPQAAFVGSPVKVKHKLINPLLIGNIVTKQSWTKDGIYIPDGFEHSLAIEAGGIIVAELNIFGFAGTGAGRD